MFGFFRRRPPSVCPRCGSIWQAQTRYQDFTRYEAKNLSSDVFSARSYSPARNCGQSFDRALLVKRAGQLLYQCDKCGYSKEY